MGGAGGGFEVHTSALAAFAATSDQRHQALEQCLARAKALTLSPDAFGHIPGIGARVYQAYDQHVQACTLGISSAAGGMSSISNATRATILDYQAANTSIEDHVAAVQWETGDFGGQGGGS